ncbi:MAG: AEC family transporter [Anaerovoracaceae bacterium]|jgi:predicted permease|nr:AEC family transporter [Anaerovoracaceae bacterium]
MGGQFIIFFALLVTGYLCRKTNLIDDGMNKSINNFIIYIAYPCLILVRIGSLEMVEGIFQNFIFTLVIYTFLFAVYGFYSLAYVHARKFPKDLRPVAEFSIISPNNGFMGYPIAFAFFGELGLLYMIACNISLNIMLFSYGIHLMKRDEEGYRMGFRVIMKSFGKLLLNPNIISAALGLIICGNNLEMPGTLVTYLELVGGVATPMVMIYIGSTLTKSNIFTIIKNKMIIEIVINRLFVIPAITLLIVFFLPMDPLIKTICVLSSAFPCAAAVPVFAELYNNKKSLASEALFLSTIISLVTLPIIITVLKYLF